MTTPMRTRSTQRPGGKPASACRICERPPSVFSGAWPNGCLYHFHDTGATSPLKKTGNVHDNHHLRHDGSNLAPFLHLLREKHDESYRTIVGTVRQAAPILPGLRA